MAIRTPLGTAQTKVSGTGLAVSAVNPPLGALLWTATFFDNAAGVPVIEWNGRILGQRVFRDNATAGKALYVATKRYVHKDATEDVNATWPSAIGERVMLVGAIGGANFIDAKSGNLHTTATQTPTTGAATGALIAVDEFVLAFFGSAGPVEDTDGTGQILDGGTFTDAAKGQVDGTTGGAPTSNVKLQEWFLELSATDGTRARINGDATSRRWANGLLALTGSKFYRQGVTPSDIQHLDTIWAGKVPPLDTKNRALVWNEELDRYEVYDVADIGTLIAHNDRGGAWTEV